MKYLLNKKNRNHISFKDKVSYFISLNFIIILLISSCSVFDVAEIEYSDISYQEMIDDVTARVVAYSYSADPTKTTYVKDRFTLVHFSDVHCSNNLWQENLQEVIDFSNQSIVKDRISALLCTGDICNGYDGREKDIALGEIEQVTGLLLNGTDLDVLNVVGNHDLNTSINGNTQYAINEFLTTSEKFQYLIEPFLAKSNINTKECYYYKDYEDGKIRLIALDFLDKELFKERNSITDPQYLDYYSFSQEQLEWLYQTLFNTPTDYAVIIANHGPFAYNLRIGDYIQGVGLIPEIVNAFKTSTQFVHNYENSNYPSLSTSVDFDFRSREPGEFVCHLAGHIHSRVVATTDKFDDQLIITTPEIFLKSPYKEGSYSSADHDFILDRNISELEKNSFNIISVDRINKQIFLTCYGAYRDSGGHFTDRTKILNY